MTIAIISFLCGFATGFLVFRNNSVKATGLEAKGRELLDALKRK